MVYEGRRGRSGYRYRGARGGKKAGGRGAGRFFSACLWILFIVVAASLAWPEAAGKVRSKVSALIGARDIGGAVQVFGQSMENGGGVAGAFRDAWSYAFRAEEDGEIKASKENLNADIPALVDEEQAEPAMSETGAPIPDGNDKPKTEDHDDAASDPVSSFKESQEEFASLGLPQNVTYEKPEIGIELVQPVDGTVTSGFGYRLHPADGKTRFHYGVDIAAAEGSQVRSAAAGQVMAVGDSTSYGLYVIIKHSDGTESLYAHMGETSVSGGSNVEAGQAIGTVGTTGNATGACLHMELIVDGNYVNPSYYMDLI